VTQPDSHGILNPWTVTKSCVRCKRLRLPYFDVLTRLGEVASVETIEAETKEVDGSQIKVATPAALYRLKKGTVRLQDRTDATALRERFNLKDES